MRNKLTTDYILEMLKEVKSLCDTNSFNCGKFIKKIPTVKEVKITKETSPNIIYEDNLALKKEIQKLKLENRDMFKDLKEHYQGRVIAEKAYTDLSTEIRGTFYKPEKDSEVFKVYKRTIEDGFIKFLNTKL